MTQPGTRSAFSSRWGGLLLLVALLGSPACSGGNEPQPKPVPYKSPQTAPRSASLSVAGRDVTVELAYTDEARTKGLMGRTQLGIDSGMLFLFTDSKPRRFWMRNTLITLDIAFLDEQGVVLNIEHGRPGVEVPGYNSQGPARFVLEMADGWCAEAGLVPGEKIEISDRLRDLAEPGPATPSLTSP